MAEVVALHRQPVLIVSGLPTGTTEVFIGNRRMSDPSHRGRHDRSGRPPARWRPALAIHLRFEIAERGEQALLAFLGDAIPFYEQLGGIRIRLLRSLDNPRRFTEIVEYRDHPTYERDQKRVAADSTMRSLLDRWHTLLVAPPETETYEDVTRRIVKGGQDAGK